MSKAENEPKSKPQRKLFNDKPNSIDDVKRIIVDEFESEAKELFVLEKTKTNENTPNEFELEIFKAKLGKHYYDQGYVWIGLHSDGFVLVVAKAQVDIDKEKYGDLFDFYKPYFSPTPRFILELDGLLTDEEQKIRKELDKKMNDYMDIAIVIPVDRINAKELERRIGDKLLERNIPILNKYSHRMGR